ncbi:MAG: FtsX-like permease family protein [Lentisphaeria bacterium]|nr:FtsX-like permease family protein [Lentisphaeria bacterium]
MRRILLTCMLLAVVCTTTARAQDNATASVQALEALLRGAQSRQPGSPGNMVLEERVAKRFADTGLPHGEIVFRLPAFRPGRASVTLQGENSPVRLLPMHPCLMRPGNFAQTDFTAPLVYAGDGGEQALAALKGRDLRNTVAVLEFHCGDEWLRLLRFGVKGFLFLAADDYRRDHLLGKVYATEVSVPRYFVSAKDSDRLRRAARGRDSQGSFHAEPSLWKNTDLRDLWVLVPGTDEKLADEVALVTAPLDANCAVPELAHGAQNAANLLLMLNLLEQFRSNPPARSVLFVAVNAHTQNYLGERILAWHLLAPRDRVEKQQDRINDDLRMQRMLLNHYSKLKLDPPNAEEEALLIAMRTLTDRSTGKELSIKESLVDLARREVNRLKGKQLKLVRQKALSEEELARERKRLGDALQEHVNVLTLFNKIGIRTVLSDLTTREVDILRNLVREITTSRSRWAELNLQEMARVSAGNEIRGALDGKQIKLAFTLELTFTGERFGFSTNNTWGEARWPYKFGGNVTRIAQELGSAGTAYLDAMTKQGGLPERHFFPVDSPAVGILQAGNRTPSFAVRTVFSDHGRAFSPRDTAENINPENLAIAAESVPALLRAILDDRMITAPSELPRPTPGQITLWVDSWAVLVKAFKFDDFSASVLPQLPVPGSVIVMHDSRMPPTPIIGGDVVNAHTALTDERATWSFYGVTASSLLTNAFHYDETFRTVDHAIDAGDAENKMTSGIGRNTPGKLLALFHCQEFPVFARDNTAAIGVRGIGVQTYKVLNGRINAAPKKYGLAGATDTFSKKSFARMNGPTAIYAEHDEPLKLLTSDMVLALNASLEDPSGVGFDTPEQLGSDFFATAVEDMATLNRHRMQTLQGVTDDLAQTFLDRGDKALEQVRDTRAANNHLGFLRALHEALGAHMKAYSRMAAITNDMLKAVVCYLALMLPFCFFLEKLLFKFKRIETEMVAFAGLFVITFAVFRNIHPAFRIAQAPEAIFIAFVMMGLGLFVIKILHGRFEGEMQLLFRTHPGMESGTADYSMVGQEAMLIGVNNMKRRRLRTTLTTATVVLVTFTMLAFTSVSKNLSPTVVTRSKRAPYTGLLYTWPGNSRMDEATARTFRELFADRGTIVQRRWLLPPKSSDQTIPYKIIGDQREASIDAVLGLSVAEDGFIAPMPMVAGAFFSADDADEVVLPSALAKSLGIGAGDCGRATVRFANHSLRVVGILRDEEFRHIHDLNQHPLMPIKALLVQPGGGADDLEAMISDDDEGDSGVFYVDLSMLLLMPIETSRRFGAQLYSVSVQLNEDVSLWTAVDELLTVTNATKFYMSSTKPFQIGAVSDRKTARGVYYIGEGYRTSIGGLAFLIIPLLISSTIILNTMLGSVFERKAEISIFNAVGLNPTHIGMFFLAESFVYSVIGSVGGYLIGQLTSIGLTRTGLITDINLNFSSLSVVYVILFTIAIVLLSTLYPCMIATKSAVPSGKRKWSMPPTDGNRMNIVFPFIYQPDLVVGLIGYLNEYFSRFTEASFGDLIAEHEATRTGTDDKERPTYGMTYNVALAPFDLGVTQRLVFNAEYDERVQAYRIAMDVARLSGQDSNWAATNRPFLEKLRTYLLHWRNLEPGEHAAFSEKGQTVLHNQQAEG